VAGHQARRVTGMALTLIVPLIAQAALIVRPLPAALSCALHPRVATHMTYMEPINLHDDEMVVQRGMAIASILAVSGWLILGTALVSLHTMHADALKVDDPLLMIGLVSCLAAAEGLTASWTASTSVPEEDADGAACIILDDPFAPQSTTFACTTKPDAPNVSCEMDWSSGEPLWLCQL